MSATARRIVDAARARLLDHRGAEIDAVQPRRQILERRARKPGAAAQIEHRPDSPVPPSSDPPARAGFAARDRKAASASARRNRRRTDRTDGAHSRLSERGRARMASRLRDFLGEPRHFGRALARKLPAPLSASPASSQAQPRKKRASSKSGSSRKARWNSRDRRRQLLLRQHRLAKRRGRRRRRRDEHARSRAPRRARQFVSPAAIERVARRVSRASNPPRPAVDQRCAANPPPHPPGLRRSAFGPQRIGIMRPGCIFRC